MLFHKEPKAILSLSKTEFRLLIDCLLLRRNKLIKSGKYTDGIDELLCKLVK